MRTFAGLTGQQQDAAMVLFIAKMTTGFCEEIRDANPSPPLLMIFPREKLEEIRQQWQGKSLSDCEHDLVAMAGSRIAELSRRMLVNAMYAENHEFVVDIYKDLEPIMNGVPSEKIAAFCDLFK
jgi:hypothetical protein